MDFDFFRLFFQNCWNCESPTWSSYTLCGNCKESFEIQVWGLQNDYHKAESFSLNFLAYYEYGIEEKLILSLKGAKCSLLNFDFVAEILVKKMCLQGLPLNNVVWVTPDSAHSVEIVKSINKITGLNSSELIMKVGPGVDQKAQKLKKTKNRKEKAFSYIGNSIDKSKNFVFIDDVVTTGSTARAAWSALGEPALFQIWSLTYRPRLAPAAFI